MNRAEAEQAMETRARIAVGEMLRWQAQRMADVPTENMPGLMLWSGLVGGLGHVVGAIVNGGVGTHLAAWKVMIRPDKLPRAVDATDPVQRQILIEIELAASDIEAKLTELASKYELPAPLKIYDSALDPRGRPG